MLEQKEALDLYLMRALATPLTTFERRLHTARLMIRGATWYYSVILINLWTRYRFVIKDSK